MISVRIKQFLDRYRVSYRIFNHKPMMHLEHIVAHLNIPRERVLKTDLIQGHFGRKILVTTLDRAVDLSRLESQLGGKIEIIPNELADCLFKDCEAGIHPPFGELYGMKLIVDKQIDVKGKLYFQPGSHAAMLELLAEDFWYLTSNADRLFFTQPAVQTQVQNLTPESAVCAQSSLKTLPWIAEQLLGIVQIKDSSIEKQAEYLACDQALNEQIVTAAENAFMKQSIFKNLIHPNSAPLSLKHFWRHNLLCAQLSRKLALLCDQSKCLDPDLAYLCGLVHNFGYLLFAKWFPHEFKLLNRWMRLHPTIAVEKLEKRLLGMGQALQLIKGGHAQLGAWLMAAWEMPQVVITVAKEHHNLSYKAEGQNYVHVVQLANQSLRKHQIGDGDPQGISSSLLAHLELSKETLMNLTTEILLKRPLVQTALSCSLTSK